MDVAPKPENGDSEVKYVVDASRVLSSNQGQIDMFEDQVAAYDTCAADEGDGSYIEVNANDDDDDINIYSDVENELIKAVGNQINGREDMPDDESGITRSSREPTGKNATDKEEGELTPEPDTTGDFRTTTTTTKDELETAISGPAPDVSKVLEEFNKRLAEIQAEAKRQSLALQKTFAEKLKVDSPVLKDAEEREKSVTPVEKISASSKPSENGSRARREGGRPETSKSSGGHRMSSRSRNESADRKRRRRSAENDKTHRRRDDRSPEKKADEEFCIDCITEKIREQAKRRNISDDSNHRRSRTRYGRRSGSPRRMRSTDRRRPSRDRSRDRRRSSRDRSRDRQRSPRDRSRDHRRSSRDRRRSSRDRSRDHQRPSRDDPSRGNTKFDKKSRSLDRTDDMRSSPSRRRRFSGRDEDCSRLSRRDRHLLTEAEKSKAANSGDERVEKRRMKTLVKRQMQIISDVIDNPNPKPGSIAMQHKESLDPDAKKTSRGSIDRNGTTESNDLNAMESFLEQLRDVRRKQNEKSEEAERLRRQRKLKVLQGAPAAVSSGSGPIQTRISIRKPADENQYVRASGKNLYFTSGSRRRARDTRSQEKENVPGNVVSRDVPATKQRSDANTKIDHQQKRKEDLPDDAKLSRLKKEQESVDGHKIEEAHLPDPVTRTQKNDKYKTKPFSRDCPAAGEPHPGSPKRPSDKRERIRKHSYDSDSSEEEEVDRTGKKKSSKIQTRKTKRLTTDPPSSSVSDGYPRKRSTHYTRNAALCKKRALRRKKTEERLKKITSSSGSESDSEAMKVKKKEKTMKHRSSVSSSSEPKHNRKPGRRRHNTASGFDSEDARRHRKVKRRVSESESDREKMRRHSKRLMRHKTVSGTESNSETTRRHSKRMLRPKTVSTDSEPEEAYHRKKRKEPPSEGSDSESYEILKKNVISLCKKNGLDLDLLHLFLGDEDDKPKHAKRKHTKKNSSKTKTTSKKSKTKEEISIPEEKKHIESEEAEDPGPTLNELEMFLGKLRENRKDTPEEEFHPALEMQSLRRECAFLDRHRAKRKAKLMACVALTAKASAKEARFLEAMKKGKDEHEIEKEKMIRKLKAGNDAIFSSLLNAKTGERRPTKEPDTKIGSNDSEDSMRNKMFGISFAFKNPLKKSALSGTDQPANTVDILASEKAQAFLNSLRAKKKVKKSSQIVEGLPEKMNSA